MSRNGGARFSYNMLFLERSGKCDWASLVKDPCQHSFPAVCTWQGKRISGSRGEDSAIPGRSQGDARVESEGVNTEDSDEIFKIWEDGIEKDVALVTVGHHDRGDAKADR